nr:MAG TPA: hypothetical protein [Caudoviricetes sp.]
MKRGGIFIPFHPLPKWLGSKEVTHSGICPRSSLIFEKGDFYETVNTYG